MKSSMRDKVEGKFHEVKGKAKEQAGKMSDDLVLEAEGNSEKILGKLQQKQGKVKKIFGK